MITSEQERGFYDAQYERFLTLPDHALRTNRGVLERNIADPAQPFYERGRLYRAAMRALEAESLTGKNVLDYGCGPADFGLWMATEGARVTLLDLSPKAIELGLRRAAASGVEVRGVAADASSLPMFHDGEFDIVFGCASLHHTMKYRGALEELARVTAAGARLVLCETWGGSALLGIARHIRSALAGEAEEQGEDIILSHRQLRRLEPWFTDIQADRFNLLAMAKRLGRGRFQSPAVRSALRAAERFDSALLAIAPPLRNWCGEAVITARRRR
jgi:SAM-dependent methyltransferase